MSESTTVSSTPKKIQTNSKAAPKDILAPPQPAIYKRSLFTSNSREQSTQSKNNRNSIETHSRNNQNSIETHGKNNQNSIETHSKNNQNSIETHSKNNQNSIETHSKNNQRSTENSKEFNRRSGAGGRGSSSGTKSYDKNGNVIHGGYGSQVGSGACRAEIILSTLALCIVAIIM